MYLPISFLDLVWTRIYQRFGYQTLYTNGNAFPLNDFHQGYGDPVNDPNDDTNPMYWLGFQQLHKMTSNYSVLRVDVITLENQQMVIDYHGFRIFSEPDYRMDYQEMKIVKSKIVDLLLMILYFTLLKI